MENEFNLPPQTSTLLKLYEKITADPRVNVWQISLYTFILTLWKKSGYETDLKVSRKLLMAGAHFGSVTTYHKCIDQLRRLQYIIYLPTYDSRQRTVVRVVV